MSILKTHSAFKILAIYKYYFSQAVISCHQGVFFICTNLNSAPRINTCRRLCSAILAVFYRTTSNTFLCNSFDSSSFGQKEDVCQLLTVLWRHQYFSSSASKTVKMKLVNWWVLQCSCCGIVIIGDKSCWMCTNTVQQNLKFENTRHYPALLL